MTLPEQLLLSDLIQRRVRSELGPDQGLDRGVGDQGWMHPPVHRLLGWVSKPDAFGSRRLVWRLDQLRGLGEQEAMVRGEPAETDLDTLGRLPTLLEAVVVGRSGESIGTVADLAVELRTGRILHYLVARSDPRLPGSSRWRLAPDRIVDQQPGQVVTAVAGLDDLPLARASVRQELLQRSRRWRQQVGQETARLRDQFQQAGERFEDRLEGWLEEPPWREEDGEDRLHRREIDEQQEPWQGFEEREPPPPPQQRQGRRRQVRDHDPQEDPWI